MTKAVLQALRGVRKVFRGLQRYYFTFVVRHQVGAFGKPLFVGGRTILTKYTFLGKNTNFNGLVVIGTGRLTIGDNFHSGQECMIITAIHDYDGGDAIPYGESVIEKSVWIEDNVWLGARVTILPGVRVGEGAIVQAGAVVVSDIPRYSIAGGNPAQVFKYRDQEHYERLKSAGKFH